MGMDIFTYQPFNLKKLNSDLGYEEDNTHGLNSLADQFQDTLSQGFQLYFEAPKLFWNRSSLGHWRKERGQLKNPSKVSFNLIKEKLKKIKSRRDDFTAFNHWQAQNLLTAKLLSNKFWQKILDEFKTDQAEVRNAKRLVKSIGQFITFTPEALLYVANEILPKLLNLINNALLELHKKENKIPQAVYQAYLQYLVSLKKRLTSNNQSFYSEKEKIVACAFTMLQRYAVNRDTNIIHYFSQQLNKKKNIIQISVTTNRAQPPLKDANFSALHELIIRFGGPDWHQRLLELPWWSISSEDRDNDMDGHEFDLTLVISERSCFAIPSQLKNFIPDKVREPVFIFFGTFIRHMFFKDQFLSLVAFKESMVALHQIVMHSKQSGCVQFSHLATLADHVSGAEKMIFGFWEKINAIKINWFLSLFSPKTVLFFTRWRTIVDHHQQILFSYKQEFSKLMIAAIASEDKKQNNDALDDLSVEDKNKIENFYAQQCSMQGGAILHVDDEGFLEESRKLFVEFSSNKTKGINKDEKYHGVDHAVLKNDTEHSALESIVPVQQSKEEIFVLHYPHVIMKLCSICLMN